MKAHAQAVKAPFLHIDFHAHPTLWKGVLAVLFGAIVALLPVPAGLRPAAWYFFALFSAVVVGLVLEPIPAAAVGVTGVALAAVGAIFGLVYLAALLAIGVPWMLFIKP